ncbi:hypothetical protein ACLB2K_020224 [Fragaria x ananassa]
MRNLFSTILTPLALTMSVPIVKAFLKKVLGFLRRLSKVSDLEDKGKKKKSVKEEKAVKTKQKAEEKNYRCCSTSFYDNSFF